VSSSVQGRTLPTARATPDAGTLKERVEKLERMIVLEVLAEHSNNKTSAAKTLGITREGLHKKMKSLGIG
jgi:transcriptional regulator with PAS, ATPase and Fis domain